MLYDEQNRPYIPWNLIHDFMKDAFVAYGLPEGDAEICTDGLAQYGLEQQKPENTDKETEKGDHGRSEKRLNRFHTCTAKAEKKRNHHQVKVSHFQFSFRIPRQAGATQNGKGAFRQSVAAGYFTHFVRE